MTLKYFVGYNNDSGYVENLTRDFDDPKKALKEAIIKGYHPENFGDEGMALYQIKANDRNNFHAEEVDWKKITT